MAKSKNAPAVNDPIEGAKLEEKGRPPPEETPPAPEPVAAAPAVMVPPPPGAPVERYRVKKKTTVSHRGQLLTLNPDDIISVEGYGPGIEQILAQNVEVEKL